MDDSVKRSQHYYRGEDWSPWKTELEEYDALDQLRQERALQLDRPSVDKYARVVETVPSYVAENLSCRFDGPTVTFGEQRVWEAPEREVLTAALGALMPWRKGPFRYGDILVDAEWRSDWKWQRIQEGLGIDLKGKRIADVGCNNLYYAYRMLAQDPELVYGIDPLPRYYAYYDLNRRFYQDPRLRFDLFGVDEMPLFRGFFDVIFLMGILYHRRDPLKTLTDMGTALKPGGQLVIESSIIPGEDSVCLFPEDRYMKAPGYWFLPTRTALEAMVRRSGFTDVRTFSVEPLTTGEQRRTPWAVFQSLSDFLDPHDPSKTVEGYPVPLRIALTARKRG